ncbi:two-component system sensor histidine kinase NtrB [Candidatus Formimonas warabiya]|uniref:histidine kinase n=1 Tax=Formimonas warabiya TaxID=1761012 RepID=A0A3G1KWN3_FORW1|nr:ATP-binding protein [Candidatus Formimonas warabiya]ATW26830.1 hypothetical protein DCMF_20540 [Candidatus Formimonas warabiya]
MTEIIHGKGEFSGKRRTDQEIKPKRENSLGEEAWEALERISDGFFALNRRGEFTYINGQAAAYFQKSSRELMGKEIWQHFPRLRETPLKKSCAKALREQKTVQFETDLVLPDRWLDMRIFPSPKGLSVYCRDITARKKREREMMKLDRLNTGGEIAAGIGHEIRNPMTCVRGFLELLAEKERNEKNHKLFELMIDELDRCNGIITKFLLLAPNRAVHLEACNLTKLVRSMEPVLVGDAEKADKRIVFDLAGVSDILLDKYEIRQLILQLTRNGLDAMPAGQTLTIKVYRQARHIFLEIQDMGPGIDAAVMERMGTPFVTTKENGTGLGLAICYSIVHRHQGELWYETGPRGTTFFVRFYVPD